MYIHTYVYSRVVKLLSDRTLTPPSCPPAPLPPCPAFHLPPDPIFQEKKIGWGRGGGGGGPGGVVQTQKRSDARTLACYFLYLGPGGELPIEKLKEKIYK